MNLTFKTVWDENRQCWISVQENTRARGKRSKSSRRIGDTATTSAKSVPSKSSAKSRRKVERPAVVLAAALLGFPSLSALAATLPEGGSLTYGQGQVTQSGNEMTITQSSDKMAIDWNSFNIGQGNKVTFVQPSSSQNKADKSNTSVSDKKENIPTDDSWSKLSGIIPIRVVKGGIKQPELEEDFQEVRRYGNGR